MYIIHYVACVSGTRYVHIHICTYVHIPSFSSVFSDVWPCPRMCPCVHTSSCLNVVAEGARAGRAKRLYSHHFSSTFDTVGLHQEISYVQLICIDYVVDDIILWTS